MNDKKQIEEMAKVISDTWLVNLDGDTFDVCEFLDKVDIESIATELYSQGYRNCKETAKEILDKVSKHYGGAWLVELYKEYGLEVD